MEAAAAEADDGGSADAAPADVPAGFERVGLRVEERVLAGDVSTDSATDDAAEMDWPSSPPCEVF